MGSHGGITGFLSAFLIRSGTTALSPSMQGHSRKAADCKWGSGPSPDPSHTGTELQTSSLQNCLSTPQAAVFYYAPQADSDTQASSFRNGSLLSPAASSSPSASTSSSSLKHPCQDRPFSLCPGTQASVANLVILAGRVKNTGVPV